MKNLAAIIIDMQEDFLKDVSDDRRSQLIESQLMMIDYFMDKKIPVLNVEFINGKPTDKKIADRIYPYASKPFMKDIGNAFSNVNLISTLNNLNVKNIFLMGMCTDLCIAYTAAYGCITHDVYTSDDVIACRDRVHNNHPKISSRKSLFFNSVSTYNKNFDRSKINYLENKYQFIDLMNLS